MKVRTLAGARRLIEPAPPTTMQPQYRWTFKTWILKAWNDYHHGYREKDLDVRTVTVIAATEEEAKRKIEAALPSTPPDEKGWDEQDKVTYKRKWSPPLGEVVEVP